MANEKTNQIKWKVQEVPTGRYASFQRRGWPDAEYADGKFAAMITCADDYVPRDVKAGTHAPLTVSVADYSFTPWKWRKMKGTFPTLAAAKAAAQNLINRMPELKGGN